MVNALPCNGHGQCEFIQFVVRPIFQPLADFCNRPPIPKSDDPAHVSEVSSVTSGPGPTPAPFGNSEYTCGGGRKSLRAFDVRN